jgi:hypothetical protein
MVDLTHRTGFASFLHMFGHLKTAPVARGLALVLVCMFAASSAWAKPWKGMVPGKTTREKVIDKFGDPSQEFSKGGKLSDGLKYEDEEAIEGSLETNFYFDRHGLLFRIDVYPARQLSRAQIERVYGKDHRQGKTSRGTTYLRYDGKGLTIFFEQDADRVRVFTFTAVSGSP